MNKASPWRGEAGARHNAGNVDKGIITDSSPCPYTSKSHFYKWLRRRRGAPRPDPGREWAHHEALRSTERYVMAICWYRDRLDNPGVHRA